MELNEENKAIINKHFKNLKENQSTIKFGTLDKRTPIFSISLNKEYYMSRLIVKRRSMKGCYTEDRTIYSKIIIDIRNRYMYETYENKNELINKTINEYLRTHLDELKSLDFLDTYEKEELTEEEKNERFDAILITLSLEGKLKDMYKTIYDNLNQEGVFRTIRLGMTLTNESIDTSFKNLARRIDNNSPKPFIERFGFDFYDFYKQINERFFEDKVPDFSKQNHYLLLKDFDSIGK